MASLPATGAKLKQFTAAQYSLLSRLLDEFLEVLPAKRTAWLAEFERRDPDSAAAFRGVFASQAVCEAEGFLEDRDLMARLLTPLDEPDSAFVGRQFGPYRVRSLLGHGGMGSVWLAERVDGLFARQVALKLVHPALGRWMSGRMAREREILAGLNHPNIAQLLDAGFADDGQPYLALEYVSGTPFTTYCDQHSLPIHARLELLLQVLGAVQYAHTHLVVHRDLKPSNILVTLEGQVRLLDFGIAKLLAEGEARESQLTRLGGRALTPDYAAPEQITGEPITTATDVYALGVMLYEILTGERPYRLKRASRGALEEAILQAEPVRLGRISPSEIAARARSTTPRRLARVLPGDLEAIAGKALRKSPAERYPTASALAEDITRFLGGEAVLAQRDTLAYRAIKFTRRHWIVIAGISALVLTLAAGLAATSYEAQVAATQRDESLQAHHRLLAQTALARLRDSDVPGALGILLEILPHRGAERSTPLQTLGVFEEARAADMRLLAMTGHSDRVRYVAFSPDGQSLLSASHDHTARIWDAATGLEILVLRGHTDAVVSAAFSPDGASVVTGSFDKTIRIWDAATGREIRVLGTPDRVRSVAFAPDGQHIVAAIYDNTARVWETATGRPTTLLRGHTDQVSSAVFSPDGQYLLTASYDRTARVWDAVSGREILTLKGHSGQLTSASFAPDGRSIVTASFDQTARVWEAATGQQIAQLGGHADLLASAAFSSDGHYIVTASYDKTVRVWDAVTARQLFVLTGQTLAVDSAAFSPDGYRVVAGSFDKVIRVWDISMRQHILSLIGHTDAVQAVAFSPDGHLVVTAAADKTARLWDATSGQQVGVLSGHTDWVDSAAFSRDGRFVVTASSDKTARIWSVASGQQLVVLSGHRAQVISADFSPDGHRVVTGSADKTAAIWEVATGLQTALLTGHTDSVYAVAFSPDGRRVLTASYDKTARIWDSVTGRQIRLLSGHTDALTSAAFFPDGRRIVTASNDKTARIWDAQTGRQIGLLRGHTHALNVVALSADGDRIATGSLDKTTRIWDVATGRQILVLAGHPDQVGSVAFSPDGERIVTGTGNVADIWDARTPALDTQIQWARAAQFDPPSAEERFELGLPADTGQSVGQSDHPGALARLAEEESGLAYRSHAAARDAHLLQSFKYYAAAVEQARLEGWSDDASRDWRYHRASLARVLAREGMMREVADAYTARAYSVREP